ncbi:MAG: hypothetical protein Q4D98_02110 [Planctomycetia bacterium]|nr:hypothetical protein [Planctomycetia bacterium]
METLRFICPPDFATPDMLRAVHLTGLDSTVVPVEAVLDGNRLTVTFPQVDNVRLNIPWTIPGIGHALIPTGTLLIREEPYYLSLELARGLCVFVRNQAADWEVLGLQPSEEFQKMIRQAGQTLSQAATMVYGKTELLPEADALANQSMQLSSRASQVLVRGYLERVLCLRKMTRQSQTVAAQMSRERNDLGGAFDEDDVASLMSQLDQKEPSATVVLDDEEDDVLFSSSDTAVHVVEPLPPKLVGVRLDYKPLESEVKQLFFRTFNSVTIDLSWEKIDENPDIVADYQKQMEWCYSNGFSVVAGPILNFFPQHIPPVLQRHKGNFGAICELVRQYVELVVKSFRSRVSTWIATSRVNSFFPLGLTALQQLELTAQIISWIREFQPTAEIITAFDQPWGENVFPKPIGAAGNGMEVLPPNVCAEILLRSKLRLAGIQLEFNVGYLDRSTYDRPPVLWSRMIDRWSCFNIPLYLSFRVPSACEDDPKACIPSPPVWKGWTPRQQAFWASTVLPLLLAKPYVYGIDWLVFRDYRPHDYPHAGLITSEGRVKKTQDILSQLQKAFSLDD